MNGHICPDLGDLPPFPRLWARWTVIAAAFAAARRPRGPRILPLLGWFDNGFGGGAVVHVLPGGRAALWGEIRTADAPGAVVAPFGYRWENDRWHQAEPFACDHRSAALPDLWSTDETIYGVTAALGGDAEQRRAAVRAILHAAEAGSVPRTLITEAFGAPEFDAGFATSQFAMAGILAAGPAGSPPASAPGGDSPRTSLPAPWGSARLPGQHMPTMRRTGPASRVPALHGPMRYCHPG
ncbi:hypothetical protein [Nocardia carnea]|uniref:hypothetical protein n=1 Tax=Nocardia carnea TaxID=37328 RepID=UPI0024577629|nr:hypothetical protein [Nocardia carnea]